MTTSCGEQHLAGAAKTGAADVAADTATCRHLPPFHDDHAVDFLAQSQALQFNPSC